MKLLPNPMLLRSVRLLCIASASFLTACNGGSGENNQPQTPAASVPSAPLAVTASAGEGQAIVRFMAPAIDGGSAVTGYTVTSWPAGGVDSDAGRPSLSHTITGLKLGVSYAFKVVASNSVGKSPESDWSDSVIPVVAEPAAVAGFTAAAPMLTPRRYHASVLLNDGRVLVTGGIDDQGDGALRSAEFFDYRSNKWTAAAPMSVGRGDHTATVMPDGKVMIVGGLGGPDALASVELFDPVANIWTQLPPLATARWDHSATLLPNGDVLVAGGRGYGALLGNNLASSERFDAARSVWLYTPPMIQPHNSTTATLLPSGQVIVAGGVSSSQVDIYDPLGNIWSAASQMRTNREEHTSTLMANGKLLVAGGQSYFCCGSPAYQPASDRTEIYDADNNSWSAAANLGAARSVHTATLLADGRILIAGGHEHPIAGFSPPIAMTEIYAPASGTWTNSGAMITPRFAHTATLLPNGSVVITGGITAEGKATADVEIFGTSTNR